MTTLLSTATRKIPRTGKRRICFPITSRAYYGRSQLLIRKLHAHPDIELELMLGGSILLDKYSWTSVFLYMVGTALLCLLLLFSVIEPIAAGRGDGAERKAK